MNHFLIILRCKKIGREESRIEGMKKGISDTASNMKTKSFDISIIAEMTGLTCEEIELLQSF